MLDERIKFVRKHFGVDFADYRRNSTGILLSSGCGIGLALMDVCPNLRFFIDVDIYRNKQIDWESIAIILTVAKPQSVVLAGWFSIDRPKVFEEFTRGVVDKSCLSVYIGGERPLDSLLSEIS
jgi:hypothetical protein